MPFTTEALASEVRFMNFGAAVTARMPRITMTTMSSIRVKPLSLICFASVIAASSVNLILA